MDGAQPETNPEEQTYNPAQARALEFLETALEDNGKYAKNALQEWPSSQPMSFKGVDINKWCLDRKLSEIRLVDLGFSKQCLDFRDCDFGKISLKLLNCTFPKGLNLSGAVFRNESSLDLAGSTVTNGEFSNLRFLGQGVVSFLNTLFRGDTSFRFLEIDGLRHFAFANPKPDLKKPGKAQIGGNSFQMRFSGRCFGTFDFQGAYFQTGKTSFRTETNTDSDACSPRLFFQKATWVGGHLDVDLSVTAEKNLVSKSRATDEGQDDPPLVSFKGVDLQYLESLSLKIESNDTQCLDFSRMTFPEHGVSDLVFGDLAPDLIFDGSVFQAPVDISQKPGSSWDGRVSFRGARFEGPVSLKRLKFTNVPDFTGTLIKHHLSFHGLEFNGRKESNEKDSQDRSARLLRLKELAGQAGDHQMALQCHAEEMREARESASGWRTWIPSFFDWLYDASSGYGQMISRPLLLLVLLWAIAGSVYSKIGSDLVSLEPWSLSAGVSLPFFTVGGVSRSEYYDLATRFVDTGPGWVVVLMGFHSLVSFILIFLVGLGLRNRFRI